MKKTILLSIVIFAFANLHAQNSAFEHYSVEQGLPSSEIYAQIQDKDGYMWFATSKGISRFDGHDFENYTVRDGLPSNSVIDISIDYKNRIWLASYNGDLSFIEDGQITEYEYNDTVRTLSQNYFIDNIYIDTLDNLWLMPSLGGLYKISKNGVVTNELSNYKKDYNFFFKEMNNGFIWCELENDNFSETLNLDVDKDIYYFNTCKNSSLRRYYSRVGEEEYLFSKGNTLFHVKNAEIVKIKKYKNDISGLLSDDKGNFWVSVMYEGAYFYPNKNIGEQNTVYLRGKSPISVYQDVEGNYWFSTTEDGVSFVSSFQFNSYKQYGFSDFNILSMEIADNFLYFSTYNKQVFKCRIDEEKILSINNIPLKKNRDYAILDIFKSSDNSVWFLGNELFKMKDSKIEIIDTMNRAYKLCEASGSGIISTSHNGFVRYLSDTINFVLSHPQIPVSNSIYEDGEGTVWIGSINGLYSYNNTLEFLGYNNMHLKARINDIKQFEKYILLATGGEGLIIYDPLIKETIIIDKTNGLNSNFVNSIFVQDRKTIWLGTNKGLCKLNISTTKGFEFETERYTKSDGLYAEEIKDIAMIGNCMYLGTSKGIVSFFPDNLRKNIVPPKIILDSIMVNDQSLDTKPNYVFKNKENSITFYFKAISFKATNKVKYKYRLEGFDNDWIETENNYVRFPNLPYGKYKFYVTATSEDGYWNGNAYEIEFKIKKHFTQLLVFKIILILLVFGIFILVFWRIYHNIEKDLHNKHKLLFAEQKALRSQMNPHFIFNALNSIRRYILENEMDTADDYLTSFATLMRMVLENSKKNFILLETELETLRLYLELEKMRFDESFEFTITKEKNISTNTIKIPPMLLQPYLENAIWHGLAPRTKAGKLELNFLLLSEDQLACVITDNGIGREKSAEISKRRKNHTSTGIKNIEERISLINTLTNSTTTVKIVDLYDENNNSVGTKVILTFPFKSFD